MWLFTNTLAELMLSYVLSYSVKYTLVCIQMGSSSCRGSSVFSGWWDLHLSVGDGLLCWERGNCNCSFPHLPCNSDIPIFG